MTCYVKLQMSANCRSDESWLRSWLKSANTVRAKLPFGSEAPRCRVSRGLTGPQSRFFICFFERRCCSADRSAFACFFFFFCRWTTRPRCCRGNSRRPWSRRWSKGTTSLIRTPTASRMKVNERQTVADVSRQLISAAVAAPRRVHSASRHMRL